MKTPVQTALILTIGIAVMLAAGCEEQNLENVRKSRLVAVENVQLKKELKQRDVKLQKCDEKIEKLKNQHKAQMQKQKDLLEKCRQEKDDCEDRLNKGFQEEVNNILDIIMKENTKLSEENDKLKKEIEKLKIELEMHKGPTPLESEAK